MTAPRIQLVARADDAGSCPSANRAVQAVLRAGLCRNVSVMACGGDFDQAADMLRQLPDACIGLHMTLNAEWDQVKWPPVLPAERVPSLVDADGMLLATPMANHERGFDADEVLAEMEAQLARMRRAGLNVAYFDEHMGFAWLAGVEERLADLARREGLLRGARTVPRLPPAEGPFADGVERFLACLAGAAPGTYLTVGHPGYDEPDMRRFAHAGLAAGQVARERDEQRRCLMDRRVLEYCAANGVVGVRYGDVL